MSWKIHMARLLLGRLSRQEVQALISEVLTTWLAGQTAEEQIAVLQMLIEDNLDSVLSGLTKKERGQLMNALLPAVAHEFPLAELDILNAFDNSEETWRG